MATLKQLYQGSPVLLSPPSMTASPTTLQTGGTLPATTAYGYRVTARIGSTETLAGVEVQITTLSGSTNSNVISWTAVPGATDYRVYGRTQSGELLMATVTAPTTTWTDTGSITPSGALPSSSGFTEGTLYTPSGSLNGLIKSVAVSNPTGYAGQLYLAVCPVAPGTPANSRILSGVIVPPDANLSVIPSLPSRFDVVPNGGRLTGYVTVPGMVLTINGTEL